MVDKIQIRNADKNIQRLRLSIGLGLRSIPYKCQHHAPANNFMRFDQKHKFFQSSLLLHDQGFSVSGRTDGAVAVAEKVLKSGEM